VANIVAMILAGGRVDDLGVLTFFRPKSGLPFGGLYRIIDFPMSNLIHSGIEKVGILSQYRPFRLIRHIANGEPWDLTGRKRCALILPPFKGRGESDWYKGTADAVYQNIDFLNLHRPDLVLILSGDHIYRMDYRHLIRFHLEKKADLTIACAKVGLEGSSRFGLAKIEDEEPRGGKVLQYLEKPRESSLEWASLTIYVFKADLLIEALKANAKKNSHEFGRDIIPIFLANHKVYAYKHNGYWGYTRTLDEYWRANMDLLGANPRINLNEYRLRTNMAHREIRDRCPAFIGPSAIIEDSLFYSGCNIEGAVIRSVLFPGVRVEKNASVKDSILFFDTTVGEGSVVCRTIADVDTRLGSNAEIGNPLGELSIIGRGTKVPPGIKIGGGVSVFPNLDEESFKNTVYTQGDIVE
jgi:glucose-1-phosphate adenylyltransferase